MVVDWTDPAKRGLREIFYFCREQGGEAYALKVAYQIQSEADALASGPFVAARERALDDRAEGFRSLVVRRRYKVVYFVADEKVTVVAVWDCRRSPITLREIFFGKRR